MLIIQDLLIFSKCLSGAHELRGDSAKIRLDNGPTQCSLYATGVLCGQTTFIVTDIQ